MASDLRAEALEPRVLLSVPAALVKDINTATGDAGPRPYFEMNGTVLFQAANADRGLEWWRTDGTAAGTRLLRDVRPGPDGSGALLNRNAAVAGGRLFFAADDGAGGSELWKTDGTPEGTVLVRDVRPGSAGSVPRHFAAVGDTLYFTADDGTRGRELWKSDGTADGTRLLKDIHPSGASDPGIDDFMWASGVINDRFVVSGGTLYFAATDAERGRELWKTDGTPEGTVPVADAVPGTAGSHAQAMIDVGGTPYFIAGPLFDSAATLYRVDPVSEAGIRPVGSVFNNGSTQLGRVGGTLLVLGGPQTEPGLYRYDPAADAALVRVRPFDRAALPASAGPQVFAAPGDGAAYFQTARPFNTPGVELWRTDGTPDGTRLVRQFSAYRGRSRGTSVQPAPVFAPSSGGSLYFAADDGEHGTELWRSDGTGPGTALVTDLNTVTRGADPTAGPTLNGRGLFAAFDAAHGTELWSTDGTADGTALVKDINPGTGEGVLFSHRFVGGTRASPTSGRSPTAVPTSVPTMAPTAGSCGLPTALRPGRPLSRT